LLCITLITEMKTIGDGGIPAMIDVTTYGANPDSGQDATAPFQRAIEAAKELGRPVTIVVPKGKYDFFSTHANRRRCYFSNATEDGSDAVRTIALDLRGLKNLTIEGAGARLVMRGNMTMLVAQGCQDLSLRGLEFDFARPTVSEITAVQKGQGFWIGRVHRDSAFRLAGKRIEWYGEDWSNFHDLVQHFDPENQTTWRGGDPTAGATQLAELGDRQIRFDVPPEALGNVVVGRTYQFRNVKRDETGMWFDRSRNVSLENVSVRAMAGFGILFQFTENVNLRHVVVAPDPATARTCASAADILHFSSCRGRVRVRDCVLSAAHDDAINVHGTHLRVTEKMGERQIRVRFMHGQTWGYAAFQAGDEVEFVRKDTLLPYSNAKVMGLEMTENPREQILTLDRPIPEGLALNSDALENTTWTPSVEVSGCDISRVPTRGILVTTRRPVRIVDNRFSRIPMPSILVEDDARGWYESGSVHDLLIEGNSFEECSGPVVEVNPQNSVYSDGVHRNVRVMHNGFLRCGLPLVSTRALNGLWFRGNRVHYGSATAPNAADFVKASQTTGIRIERNALIPAANNRAKSH